jgi:hypothetical protein
MGSGEHGKERRGRVKRRKCVRHGRRSERTEAEREKEKASQEAEEAEPLPVELAAMGREC